MSKADFVTCAACRATIARSKTYAGYGDERLCADSYACGRRRIARDERWNAELAREEVERWDEQFNPKRGRAR